MSKPAIPRSESSHRTRPPTPTSRKNALIDTVLEATFDDWLDYNAAPFEDSAEHASTELEARITGAVEFARAPAEASSNASNSDAPSPQKAPRKDLRSG